MVSNTVHQCRRTKSMETWLRSLLCCGPEGDNENDRKGVVVVIALLLLCFRLVVRLISQTSRLYFTRKAKEENSNYEVCLLVGCLTSQQQASVSQGRICSDNVMCCHTEIEAADQTFYLTQSQYTDTGPTSPSADPITPGAWQGSHWSANF